MSKDDLIIDELVDSQVEALLEEDSYYQMYATPLKPANQVKEEHRKQLKELVSLNDMRSQLDKAQSLILSLMPHFVPPEEFSKIQNEIESAPEHFMQHLQAEGDAEKIFLLQTIFGFSNETLISIYKLAADLFQKGHFEDALAIFTFLSTMAPHVTSYWVAQGVCLQSLNRNEEAIVAFTAAKLLNPSDPVPLSHLIECYLSLKDHEKAKMEQEELKAIHKSL